MAVRAGGAAPPTPLQDGEEEPEHQSTGKANSHGACLHITLLTVLLYEDSLSYHVVNEEGL